MASRCPAAPREAPPRSFARSAWAAKRKLAFGFPNAASSRERKETAPCFENNPRENRRCSHAALRGFALPESRRLRDSYRIRFTRFAIVWIGSRSRLQISANRLSIRPTSHSENNDAQTLQTDCAIPFSGLVFSLMLSSESRFGLAITGTS